MKIKITPHYDSGNNPCSYTATVGAKSFAAIGESWDEAKQRIIQKIVEHSVATSGMPEPEEIEV